MDATGADDGSRHICAASCQPPFHAFKQPRRIDISRPARVSDIEASRYQRILLLLAGTIISFSRDEVSRFDVISG